MMKRLYLLKQTAPCCLLLPTIVVGVCTGTSLVGYHAPTYSVNEVEEIDTVEGVQAEAVFTTACTEQRTLTTMTAMTTMTASKIKEAASIEEPDGYKDGVYTGTGTGFSGPLTVSVTIQDGKISDIEIVSSQDDAPYLNAASTLLETIKAKQTTNVDIISGATYSSVGLIEAVRDALKQAGGSVEAEKALPTLEAVSVPDEDAPSIEMVSEPSAYKDGVYTGTGTGFSGPLTVQVTVTGSKIADISILSTNDDSPYINNASALLGQIVASQSTNVDAVSGATFSSAGIIEAVRNALSQADVDSNSERPTEVVTEPDEDTTVIFPYNDGVYLGTGEGYRGETKVAVSLKNGRIQTILVLSTDDDKAFFERAESGVVSAILKQQSLEVDAVSGATFSSEGILEAIETALKSACTASATEPASTTAATTETTIITTATVITPETETTAVTTAPIITSETEATTSQIVQKPAFQKYADGIYTVSAICEPDADEDFEPYTLTLTLTIQDDIITEILDITGSGSDYDEENDWYISRAANGTSRIKGVIPQLLELQDTNGIDAVSGATCSSDAIVKALALALEKAQLEEGSIEE